MTCKPHLWFHSADMHHNICGKCRLHECYVDNGWEYHQHDSCPVCIERDGRATDTPEEKGE